MFATGFVSYTYHFRVVNIPMKPNAGHEGIRTLTSHIFKDCTDQLQTFLWNSESFTYTTNRLASQNQTTAVHFLLHCYLTSPLTDIMQACMAESLVKVNLSLQ